MWVNKKNEYFSLFHSDPKQDISASVSRPEKRINNNNNNDNGDVSTTKQSSSLDYTRNNYNNCSNSNSKSNNKHVQVIDAKIKEIDQSTQKVNKTTGQGIGSKPKKKKVVILFKIDSKQNIPTPVSQSAKIINNNNNNNDDDVSNTKQSSSLVNTHNNINSNSNNNSNSYRNNQNINTLDARTTEIDKPTQNVDNNTGKGIVGKPRKRKVVSSPTSDPKHDSSASIPNSAKSIKNTINNDDDAVYTTKQSSSLVNNRNKVNNNTNSNRHVLGLGGTLLVGL